MSDQSWAVTGPQTIDISGVTSLKLGMVQGRFEVLAHPGPSTLIEVSDVHGDPVAVSLEGGRLEIRHQLQGAHGWFKNLMESVSHHSDNSAVISIRIPADADVEAGAVSGEGRVCGTTGRTRLNTVSGPVTTEETAGELHVNTVSGAVTAQGHTGIFTAKSVSGDVTASGRLTNVRASTVSGDLTFDLLGFAHDFGSNSVSGNLTIRLPHNVGVDLIAKSATGAVVINGQHLPQTGGKVETIAGPDQQLMLARTNSVSGTTSILHGGSPNSREAEH